MKIDGARLKYDSFQGMNSNQAHFFVHLWYNG